jgi:PPOX class probable F420-dependent enzyme
MDIAEALDHFRDHHRGVLATMRADGTPQLSPVGVTVDAEHRIAISTRETAIKVRNLRRDPRAWVCGFEDAFFGRWVQVGGDARILSLPDALEPLVAYYRAAAGEHPDWAEYRAAMVRDQRCLVLITPTSAGPSISG